MPVTRQTSIAARYRPRWSPRRCRRPYRLIVCAAAFAGGLAMTFAAPATAGFIYRPDPAASANSGARPIETAAVATGTLETGLTETGAKRGGAAGVEAPGTREYATPETGTSETGTPGIGVPAAACGFSSASLLAAPAAGSSLYRVGSGEAVPRPRGPSDSRRVYWLRCGEPLVAALARWGRRENVLIITPLAPHQGAMRWRVSTDYRFHAADLQAALALLAQHLDHRTAVPVFHYDAANRVVTVRRPVRRQEG